MKRAISLLLAVLMMTCAMLSLAEGKENQSSIDELKANVERKAGSEDAFKADAADPWAVQKTCGSTLSEGNLLILCAGGALVIGFVGGFAVGRKKKKDK